MKNVIIVLIVMLSGILYGQNDHNSIRVEISEIKIGKGLDCGIGHGLCEGAVAVLPSVYYRSNENLYGAFFLDNKDTLKLSIEKKTLSLALILNLFKDYSFKVNTQIYLPTEVIKKLKLDDKYLVISKGSYRVNDSEDNESIVVTFGSVKTESEDNNDRINLDSKRIEDDRMNSEINNNDWE